MDVVGESIGKYEILESLGRGGVAAVYKARDVGTGRIVAVKILGQQLDPVSVRRFRDEAEILARLDHPNIVRVYEVGEFDGTLLYSLEYVAGSSVDHLVETAREQDETVAFPRAISIALDVLSALHYIGKLALCHRDIKPANILLDESGRALLGDFGLARFRYHTHLTKTGHVFGTLRYMSPEQIIGDDIDQRSDLYQVGLLLYEMVYGDLPHADKNMYSQARLRCEKDIVIPEVPAVSAPGGIDMVIRRACARDPRMRYPNARAMAIDLARAAETTIPSVIVPEFLEPPESLVAVTATVLTDRSAFHPQGLAGSRFLTALVGLIVGVLLTVCVLYRDTSAHLDEPFRAVREQVKGGRVAAAARMLSAALAGHSPREEAAVQDVHQASEVVASVVGLLGDEEEERRLKKVLCRQLMEWTSRHHTARTSAATVVVGHARRLAEQNSTDEALALLRHVIDDEAPHRDGSLLAARLLLDTGRRKEALVETRRAWRTGPLPESLALAVAAIAADEEQWALGSLLVREVLERDPSSLPARLLLAEILGGETSDDREEVRRLIANDEPWKCAPTSLQVRRLLLLAEVELEANNEKTALRHSLQADALAPSLETAAALVNVYRERRRGSMVLRHLKRALAYSPDDADLLAETLGRAVAFESPERDTYLERLRRLDPSRAILGETLHELIEAQRTGRVEELEKLARKVMRALPEEALGYTFLSFSLWRQGKVGRAFKVVEDGLKLQRDNHWLLYILAECLVALRQYDRAGRYYRRALQCHPGFGPALDRYYRMVERTGRYEESMARSKYLLGVWPGYTDFTLLRAFALANLGRLEELPPLLDEHDGYEMEKLRPHPLVEFSGWKARPRGLRQLRLLATRSFRLGTLLALARWEDARALGAAAIDDAQAITAETLGKVQTEYRAVLLLATRQGLQAHYELFDELLDVLPGSTAATKCKVRIYSAHNKVVATTTLSVPPSPERFKKSLRSLSRKTEQEFLRLQRLQKQLTESAAGK